MLSDPTGKVKIAELLIGAKADITAANTEGATPLHKAAACGSIEVVCIILSASGPNAAHLVQCILPALPLHLPTVRMYQLPQPYLATLQRIIY